MRIFLIYFSFIGCLIVSCKKSPVKSEENDVVSNKVFTPVSLFGNAGNWGGGICSWGFVMVRKDSTSIVYHSTALPANTNISNTPVLVNILFHDTVQLSNCWREIVVDSIKF